jgi:outer membrane protein OmpA-like peptidoglycan-associated protein
MRRLLVYIFSLTIILSALSQNPQTKEFSRWSITPEYGYSIFDGDINQSITNIFPTSFRNVNFGGTLEYAFTPIWGISLDYFYFPLRAQNSSPASIDINTDLSTSCLNATINFTRWIFPETKSKFYVSGSIGIGLSYYTFDVRYLNGDPVLPGDTYVDVKRSGQVLPIIVKDKYGLAGTIPVTFSVEYNMSKPLAVGVRIHYRAHTKDNLEGVGYLNYDGVTNDVIEAGTLYARIKFNVFKKDHIRVIPVSVFDPDKGLVVANDLAKKLDKLKLRVDNLNAKVDSLIPRVEKLENILSNDGPDSDGDGVPDVRDLSPNTPPNTPVDFWGRPLAIQSITTTQVPVNSTNIVAADVSKNRINWDDIPAVYFDFDRIDLDNDALVTISKISAKMKADPSLCVEVRGYCDYMGNNPYNNLLSQRRSDRVKAEMVKIWGIPFDRIISNGKGKVIEPKIKYRPNRRCDFFFGKL